MPPATSAFDIPLSVEPRRQRSFRCFLSTLFLLSAAFFIGSALIVTDYKERYLSWGSVDAIQNTRSKMCESQCMSRGSESLPKGIVSKTSDLKMRPLWGPMDKKNSKPFTNLLGIAAGIKQKESVNKIVKKFLSSDFIVMLFHYDGNVDDWRDLDWSNRAIHVSAINQTKWWFAKRFLHPDIVSEYGYIFLWDEDLGVENFDVGRYLTIIKEEGLEISQPALDPLVSEVHHHLTARDSRSKVHRRTYKMIGRRRCDENSTEPPCTGWVEMMAPVFSRASWRCAWHMIQNDLVHAWGLDFQLGYCVQGNRTKNIGIVDSEYVVHYGLPTLGSSVANKKVAEAPNQSTQDMSSSSGPLEASQSHQSDGRAGVRTRSYIELEIFKNRWKKAVKEDNCWVDSYQKPLL
ncbi:uncharacterized protein LOC133880578 isoform X2 [Alnus glutinosa]|uniref:uncharacterized protein LOC133880578 isoform X2 n=1 Tax=Alnus glutinosa TaxID=3517 RepID=UPI002D7819BF|nr:uncharacterized protein LOC133880578 isoform X2 [Alnus glutinosa]